MEFPFDCEELLHPNASGIAIVDGTQSMIKGPQHYAAGNRSNPTQEKLDEIIDKLGEASSKVRINSNFQTFSPPPLDIPHL